MVRLTGERGRGCNGSCRLALGGSGVPARGCYSMETISSVPRTSCFIFGPKAAGSVGRSHRRFADVIDNTVETSTRVRTPRPARQGGSMAWARPVNRGPRACARLRPEQGTSRAAFRRETAHVHRIGSDRADRQPPEPGGLPEEALARHASPNTSTSSARDPKVTRTAYQRLYDMILSHGTEEVVVNKEKLVRYKFFDDPDQRRPGRRSSASTGR